MVLPVAGGGGGSSPPRVYGRWDHYPVTGDQIRSAVTGVDKEGSALHGLSGKIQRAHQGANASVDADLKNPIAEAPKKAMQVTEKLGSDSIYAAAALKHWSKGVDDFDEIVNICNRRMKNVGDFPDTAAGQVAERKATGSAMRLGNLQYRGAEQALDQVADSVAAELRHPTPKNIRKLMDLGCLPLNAAVYFPNVHFTHKDYVKAIQAKIAAGELPDFGEMSGGAVSRYLDSHPELRPYIPIITMMNLGQLTSSVSVDELNAFLDLEVEAFSWKGHAHAEADYSVFRDGHVEMSLMLLAGLGREFGPASAEAGGKTLLNLRFDSRKEAQKFLDGLDDAAGDLDGTDWLDPPAAVVQNVTDYIRTESDVTDVRVGAYAKGEIEFGDESSAKLSADLQAEAFIDLADGEKGVQVSGSAELESPEGTVNVSTKAALTVDSDNQFENATLNQQMSGTVAMEKLGIHIPNLEAGDGVDITYTINKNNPAADDIVNAIADGDMGRATHLALQHAKVVIKQTSVVTNDSEHGLDLGAASVTLKSGVDETHTTDVWVKPPYGHKYMYVDPSKVQ